MYQYVFSVVKAKIEALFQPRLLSTERLFMGMTLFCVYNWSLEWTGIHVMDAPLLAFSAFMQSGIFSVLAVRIVMGTARDFIDQNGQKPPRWLDHPGDEH